MSALIPASELPAAVAIFVVSIGVAAVYVFVGLRLYRRPVTPGAQLASAQLSLWWAGLGVTTALGGLEVGLAAAGALSFAAALTCYMVLVLIDCAFLWGLVGFLLYVYTGKYHLLALSAFYAWFYVTVVYYFFSQQPTAVTITGGQMVFVYLVQPTPVLEGVLVLGLLGPEIVGALLYLSLLRRTDDSAQRYRITLVGGGILLWFLLDLLVPSSTADWTIVRGVVQVIPGLMSLIAYYPPEWARRRYGVTVVGGDESLSPRPARGP